MNNVPFGVRLRLRCMTHAQLAEAIGSSRSHVSLVLSNTPGRGGKTRKKLARLLTSDERGLLGWDAHGNLLERTRVGRWHVERDAQGRVHPMFHAEQNVPTP